MVTAAPPPDGSFPRPPRSFEDGTGRQIAVAADDGDDESVHDGLAAMYADFTDADHSQFETTAEEVELEMELSLGGGSGTDPRR